MSKYDERCLPDGGEEMGMTDMQFKTYLKTQLNMWKEVLKLAEKAGNTEIQEKAQQQIDDIDYSLKL